VTLSGAQAHTAVLLDECIDGLAIRADGIYMDGTFGRGGHSAAILARLGPEGRLYAVDKDATAVSFGRERFAADPRFHIAQRSFAELLDYAREQGVAGKVNGLLLDLGVSSPQLDDAGRGFSFMQDGPLDMRMNRDAGQSAAEWLAEADEADIARVLKDYGEERFARRIARAIVETRVASPLTTTAQLAALIVRASPKTEKHKHPATRSFQAIRIFINRELEDLRLLLDQALELLAVGARLAVISFHSLEDRIVKRFMQDAARGEQFPKGLPVPDSARNPKLRLIGKAIKASAAEIDANPRARSAVLRIAERLA
jgi:16S rRNA (cytosine1402-N4)-methyltransferase